MKNQTERRTLTRLRALLVTLGLVLGSLTGAVVTATPAAAGTGDNYPSNWKTAPISTVVDSWGYYNRNCTSWAAWALHDRNGFEMPRAIGNAANWGVWANSHGYAVNSTPALGAVAWWGANTYDQGWNVGAYGHVAWVSAINGDSVLIEEYNYGGSGAYRTRWMPASNAKYIHFKDIGGVSSGSYIRASDTGKIYVMAGGSPMYVSAWSAVGGERPISATYTQAQIDQMPRYPADGTAIRNYGTGGIYVVAGGFAFGVSNLAHIPNTSWVNVDGAAIGHLRSQPADETVIRDYVSGAIYVVSGGAPLAVKSLSRVPYKSWTNIDGWAIDAQLRKYPTDGSVIVDYSSGTVYVVAGGAAMAVTSFENIPPVTSLAYVDSWAITNQLRQYPANGTVIRNYKTGGIYVVAGGAALGVASLNNVPYSSWINLDGWSIVNQLRDYPADGTYVRGWTTGKIYAVQDGQTTHLSSWGPAGPQPYTNVDQWAITNQLNAAE